VLAEEWDDFLAEKPDRLEGKFWVHTGVVEAKPHEGHFELVPVLHDALGNLFRGTDEDSLLLELIEVEVVPFARLAPTRSARRLSWATCISRKSGSPSNGRPSSSSRAR